jgi:transposase
MIATGNPVLSWRPRFPLWRLSDEEVFWGYKEQVHVERGFRFLKDPLFFASSLFGQTVAQIYQISTG